MRTSSFDSGEERGRGGDFKTYENIYEHFIIEKVRSLSNIRYFLIIFISFLLIGVSIDCNADGGKYWKQKRERYEKAKLEAQQKGKVFDPNEFEEQERIRAEKNNLSPLQVICILGGIIGVAYLIIVLVSKVQEFFNTKRGKQVLFFIVILIFLILIVLFSGENKFGRDYYDDEIPYGRIHTDRHY